MFASGFLRAGCTRGRAEVASRAPPKTTNASRSSATCKCVLAAARPVIDAISRKRAPCQLGAVRRRSLLRAAACALAAPRTHAALAPPAMPP